MATRINDLTEAVKKDAEKLTAKCGTLKMALSAGIVALMHASAEEREHFMELASGFHEETVISEATQIMRIISASGTEIKFASNADKIAFEKLRLLLDPNSNPGFQDAQNAELRSKKDRVNTKQKHISPRSA